MEAITTAHYSLVSNSHSIPKLLIKPSSQLSAPPPPFFHSNSNSNSNSNSKASLFVASEGLGGVGIGIKTKHPRRSSIYASSPSKAQTPTTTDVSQKWLLEPVGDGDTRHIGFKVPMPNAFEIASSEVTVGRLPEKADLVIPVATVSGVHARIQKKEGNLLVTDLDSTNGTFIDEKRLRPGVVATAPPGSCVTFGDEHLAVFRVSKLENVEATAAASNPDTSATKVEPEIPNENTTTT